MRTVWLQACFADAVVAMLEFKPKKEIHIGYAYDYTISAFTGTNTGSHEILLRYEPQASKLKPGTSPFYNKPKAKGYGKKSYRQYQQKKKKRIKSNSRAKRRF